MPNAGPDRLRAAILAAALALGAGPAPAQEPVDPAVRQRGEALYGQYCALCHKDEGQGYRDAFPALARNPNLEDAAYVVTSIHQGVVVMPPFPWLSDEEVAALATYVRSAFGNDYGAVSVEDVAALRADLDPAGGTRTIWDGVYTQEQADRGEAAYNGACGLCHGRRLNGAPDDQDMRPAPPLARANFLRNWDGRSLGMLHAYTLMTMPQSNPGFLPEEDYIAMVAHMLATTGAPAGTEPLPLDIQALGRILIGPQP